MIVTEYFIIGKATVPSTWIALITAFIVAYSAVRIRYGKRIADVLIDSFFYFVLVWKLSVIVTDFEHIIQSPLSILYFNGGLIGFYLGLLAAAGRVLVELKKKPLSLIDRIALLKGVVMIQAVYQIMMVLLNEGAFIAQVATIVIFVLFALFAWFPIDKGKSSPRQLAFLFMAVHFFAASFQPAGILGTSMLATLFMGLFMVVFVVKGHNEESEGIL